MASALMWLITLKDLEVVQGHRHRRLRPDEAVPFGAQLHHGVLEALDVVVLDLAGDAYRHRRQVERAVGVDAHRDSGPAAP